MKCEMERKVKCTFDSECSRRKRLSGSSQRESFTALQLGLPVHLTWKAVHCLIQILLISVYFKGTNLVLPHLKEMLKTTNPKAVHLFSLIWLWSSVKLLFPGFLCPSSYLESWAVAASCCKWVPVAMLSWGAEEYIARTRNNLRPRHTELTQ